MEEIELTSYLAHNYIPVGKYNSKDFKAVPVKFSIAKSKVEMVEGIVTQFQNLDWKRSEVKGLQAISITSELAFFSLKISEWFSRIDYELDKELRRNEWKEYHSFNRKKGVEQFFRLDKICCSPTIGEIKILDNRNGEESITSPELIKFICNAIREKFESAVTNQTMEYAGFVLDKEVYDYNLFGKHIVGSYNTDRIRIAYDLFAFIVYELNLTVYNQLCRLAALLSFHSGFPFFQGKGDKERLYDTWDNDLVKQFRNIVTSVPSDPEGEGNWAELQWAFADSLPPKERDAYNDKIHKLMHSKHK